MNMAELEHLHEERELGKLRLGRDKLMTEIVSRNLMC